MQLESPIWKEFGGLPSWQLSYGAKGFHLHRCTSIYKLLRTEIRTTARRSPGTRLPTPSYFMVLSLESAGGTGSSID